LYVVATRVMCVHLGDVGYKHTPPATAWLQASKQASKPAEMVVVCAESAA
jgi:hypothetical protein